MAKEQALVKYGGFDIDEADEQLNDPNRNQSVFMGKLPVGKTVVRFIPPLEGKKLMRVQYIHYVDVPGVGRASFTCPLVEAGKPCRVCKKQKQLAASDKPIDVKKAKRLKPKRRLMSSVLVRSNAEAGAKVLTFGSQIEEQLIEIRKNEDEGGDFVHPVKGFDIAIIRKGTGEQDTEYTVMPANKGKVLPLLDDVKAMNELISTQPNLDSFVKVYDDEDIEKILNGEKPGDDDDGGGSRSSGKKPSKTASDEIEDEDEEIEIDDE